MACIEATCTQPPPALNHTYEPSRPVAFVGGLVSAVVDKDAFFAPSWWNVPLTNGKEVLLDKPDMLGEQPPVFFEEDVLALGQGRP